MFNWRLKPSRSPRLRLDLQMTDLLLEVFEAREEDYVQDAGAHNRYSKAREVTRPGHVSCAGGTPCGPQLGIGGSANQAQAVVDAVRQGRGAGQGWLSQNKLYIFGACIFVYVMIARLVGEGRETRA